MTLATVHNIDSPFHPGERAVQHQAGVREEAEKRGQRMLTPDLNNQQLAFFRQLPFLVSAHTDTSGQPWAGLLTGKPGFVAINENNRQFALDWRRTGNPTGVSVQAGGDIGLLGIELATRRRNRLNGTVFATDEDQWRILIEQAYGNCPKYISERQWPAALFEGAYKLEEQTGLSEPARALAERADTFFIATSSGPLREDSDTQHSAWGADISHRGGEAGFLRVDKGALMFEDYPGNNMFNTLGNITQHPPCGILLLDFDNGDIVQLAARATIVHSEDNRRISLDITSSRHWHAAGQTAA
jgi:predicted pyridoxine 5'-phosphate oxidase superfamily flavin-nucleotide-binding protein